MSQMRLQMTARILCAAVTFGPTLSNAQQAHVANGNRTAAQPSPGADEPEEVHGSGTIRGRVIDVTRGLPLRRVNVTATAHERRLPSSTGVGSIGRGLSFVTQTDEQGTYSFSDLPAARYYIHVHREGYHESRRNATSVVLAEGASAVIEDVGLTRGGVITGRVLDDVGEPVSRATVAAVGRGMSGREQLRQQGNVVTDDRGAYRLAGLPPGRYTVWVAPLTRSRLGANGIMQGEMPELLPTFAVSTNEPGDAEFVQVSAGEDVSLDVRALSGRTSTLSGLVIAEDTAPLGQVMITLRSAAHGIDSMHSFARPGQDGRFEVLDVAPGRYVLVAAAAQPSAANRPSPQLPAGWIEVAVNGTDVRDLVVPLGNGASVRGRVEVEGGEVDALAKVRPRVLARQLALARLPRSSSDVPFSDDLTFQLSGVRGPTLLSVAPLPQGWWVKAVTLDGRDVTTGYDYPQRGTLDGVVIVLSAEPTGVSGQVEAAGASMQGAVVLAEPLDETLTDDERGMASRMTAVAPDGTFTVAAVRPGRYGLLALTQEALRQRGAQDAEQQSNVLASHGAVVDVIEGRIATVSVRLVER